jgi:hypothetical protein
METEIWLNFYLPAKNKDPTFLQKMGSYRTDSWTSLSVRGLPVLKKPKIE